MWDGGGEGMCVGGGGRGGEVCCRCMRIYGIVGAGGGEYDAAVISGTVQTRVSLKRRLREWPGGVVVVAVVPAIKHTRRLNNTETSVLSNRVGSCIRLCTFSSPSSPYPHPRLAGSFVILSPPSLPPLLY